MPEEIKPAEKSKFQEMLVNPLHSLWYTMRPFFHWKFSQAFIPIWFGAAVAMILSDHFIWAYVFFIFLGLWSVACWLASDHLKEKKKALESRKLKKDEPRFKKAKQSYLVQLWGVSALLLLIGSVGLLFTRVSQANYELSKMGGTLVPANDPDPQTPYCASELTGDLKIYLGDGLEMGATGFPFNPVGLCWRLCKTKQRNQRLLR